MKQSKVAIVAQITSYFKLAVKRNKGNVSAIIDAVNAIPMLLSANMKCQEISGYAQDIQSLGVAINQQ